MKTTQFTNESFFTQTIVSSFANQIHRPYVKNDYEENLKRKKELIESFQNLSKDEKKKYNGLRQYFDASDYKDLDSHEKNYQYFQEEIKVRIENKEPPKLLRMSALSAESDVLELLHSFENIEKIKNLYKYQKQTCSSKGINTETAEQLKYCFMQGRELFCSGKRSDTSVKPLLFFYSLTAYSFCMIVLNNPIRFSLDSLNGHHGLDYVHDEFIVKFGGDTPYGTFTDLFQSFPVYSLMDKTGQQYKQNRFESINEFFKKEIKIKLGSLFAYIPELSDSIQQISKTSTYCYHLSIKPTSQEREWGYEIIVGNGKEGLDSMKSELDLLFNSQSCQSDGKLKYFIKDSDFLTLNINIYQDIYGETYLVYDKVGYAMPELLVHFMILFAFSNIQRYDPPLWGEILSNKIDSNISYLIYRYFSIFENKLPYLILRTLGADYPVLV